MHEKIKSAVGIQCANCMTCVHLGSDGDGYEYNGTWSVCNKFHNYVYLKPFPFKTEQKCWEPDFWHSKFAKQIDGSHESVMNEIGKFKEAK